MTGLVAGRGRGRGQGGGLGDLPPTCSAAHMKVGSATGLADLPTCSAAHSKVGSATGERGEGVQA